MMIQANLYELDVLFVLMCIAKGAKIVWCRAILTRFRIRHNIKPREAWLGTSVDDSLALKGSNHVI
jgi:hypothetical protein